MMGSFDVEASWGYRQAVERAAQSKLGRKLFTEERAKELASRGVGGYVEAMAEKIDAVTDLNMARWWAEKNGWDFNTKFAADVDKMVAELSAKA